MKSLAPQGLHDLFPASVRQTRLQRKLRFRLPRPGGGEGLLVPGQRRDVTMLPKPGPAPCLRRCEVDDNVKRELEAATFRHLVGYLREHAEVQNIDLMNLAGFCRNCLSKWYRAAAEERGVELDYEAAREIIYGMPYDAWKKKHQKEATPEQAAAYAARKAGA